jgi:diacylglycerol kinase family enzyme
MLILNGKKAGRPDIRQAVNTLHDAQHQLDVRVTWEAGDIPRYIDEACEREIERVVIGGGDGSVNEATNTILNRKGKVPALGIMPLGTANDFATSCRIPNEPIESLTLALTGTPVSIDACRANEKFFLNVATAGFGAVRNGRSAGGGQQLAPEALLNDGLLDVLIVNRFSMADMPQVLEELRTPGGEGKFIQKFQTASLECESEHKIPINLDGEPYAMNQIRFSV